MVLQTVIVTSIYIGQFEMRCLGEAEFTENTLVEVTVPAERDGSQPWLVRDGDIEYSVLKHDQVGKPYLDHKNTIFDRRSETLFWIVPKNHTLYQTHTKAFDGKWNSWMMDVCRVLAMGLLCLNLGSECVDIFQFHQLISWHLWLDGGSPPDGRLINHWSLPYMITSYVRLLSLVYSYWVSFTIILKSETTLDI